MTFKFWVIFIKFSRNKCRSFSLKGLITYSLVTNQDLQNQYLNLTLKENDTRLIEAKRKPKLSFRAGISEELNTSKFTDEGRENGGVFDFYTNLSLSYNLLDGGKLRQKIQEAEVNELVAQRQIDKQIQLLTEKLQLSFNRYEQYIAVLQLQKRLIKNLTKNTDLAQERFESGYSIFIEFRDLQIQLLEAKLDLLQTTYDLKVAETEIIRQIGGITRKR